jgi:hypothetical protein
LTRCPNPVETELQRRVGAPFETNFPVDNLKGVRPLKRKIELSAGRSAVDLKLSPALDHCSCAPVVTSIVVIHRSSRKIADGSHQFCFRSGVPLFRVRETVVILQEEHGRIPITLREGHPGPIEGVILSKDR